MTRKKDGLSRTFSAGLLIIVAITSVESLQGNVNDIDQFLIKSGGCESKSENLRGCYCDEVCMLYGDCCSGHPSFNEVQQRQTRGSVKCVKIEVDDHPGKGLYMVAKCPTDWKNGRIKEKCEAEDGHKDRFVSEPVINRNSSALYRNMYCAHCNKVEEFDFYGVHVTCEPLNNQQNCPLEYKKGGKNITLKHSRNSSDYSDANCNFSGPYDAKQDNIYHNDDEDGLKEYRFRLCVPEVIETCARGWPHDDVFTKCGTYTLYVYVRELDSPPQIYRNPYCKLCNNATNFNNKDLNIYPGMQIVQVGFVVDKTTFNYFNCLLTNSSKDWSENYQFKKSHDEDPIISPFIIFLIILLAFCMTPVVFLSLHLIAFFRIPREIRTLMDRNLACHCFANLMTCTCSISWIIMIFSWWTDNTIILLASLFYLYFYHASLLWMLTMSYDVWRSMREASKCIRRESPREERRRFTVYSWWNWSLAGLMLLIVCLPVPFDTNYSMYNSTLYYFFCIVNVVVLVLNSFFFVHSLYLISKSSIKPRFAGAPSNLIRLSSSDDVAGTTQQCSPISVTEIKWHIRRFLILLLPTGFIPTIGFISCVLWPNHVTILMLIAIYQGHPILFFILFSRKKKKLAATRKPGGNS